MENNNVLATVNGVEITEEVLNNTIERFPAEQKIFFDSEQGRKQLLDQMINVELINAYGSEKGVENDEFYRVQMEQAEKDIRFNATMNRLMQDISVSDADAKTKYDENPDEYKEPETIGAKHILVDDKAKADEIKAKLDNKEMTFAEAATEYSSCPSKENGGDLGTFGKGMMVAEFEEAAMASEVGTVTEPVETQFGFHIIEVYEKNEAQVKDFDEVKDSIKESLLQEKQMEKYNALINDLREQYFAKEEK